MTHPRLWRGTRPGGRAHGLGGSFARPTCGGTSTIPSSSTAVSKCLDGVVLMSPKPTSAGGDERHAPMWQPEGQARQRPNQPPKPPVGAKAAPHPAPPPHPPARPSEGDKGGATPPCHERRAATAAGARARRPAEVVRYAGSPPFACNHKPIILRARRTRITRRHFPLRGSFAAADQSLLLGAQRRALP